MPIGSDEPKISHWFRQDCHFSFSFLILLNTVTTSTSPIWDTMTRVTSAEDVGHQHGAIGPFGRSQGAQGHG